MPGGLAGDPAKIPGGVEAGRGAVFNGGSGGGGRVGEGLRTGEGAEITGGVGGPGGRVGVPLLSVDGAGPGVDWTSGAGDRGGGDGELV